MRHLFLLLLSVLLLTFSSKAQVGIGNSLPATKSILDLSNMNAKFIVLPKTTTGIPDTTALDTTAALIYYNGNLYFRAEGSEINALSPWKWDGNATHAFYSPSGLPVGIGNSIPTSGPLAATYLNYRILIAKSATDIGVNGTKAAPLLIGDLSDLNAQQLVIDDDEIMSKSAPNIGGNLKLQEEDGTVQIRSSGADALTTTVLNTYGSSNVTGKVREKGNDLIPRGAIIMWGGATAKIPAGWMLCDGSVATDSLKPIVGNNVPDLRARFIVGTGSGSGYTDKQTGGNTNNFLTIGQLPPHSHTATVSTDPGHTHGYNDLTVSREDVNGSNFNNQGIDGTPDNARTTALGGAHTHTVTNSLTGSGNAIENRPPYYALAYIIKM